MTDQIDPLALIASLIQGDRWLNADAAAVHLGMIGKDGKPNRRGFLERVACTPGFPAPMRIGGHAAWRKSELDQWAEARRAA